ncbi:MAG TPA: IS630 family transposase [Abditibacteriaceae bacterium]|nr:IS630 family transposase [Abditibacteriaceae bacterium]
MSASERNEAARAQWRAKASGWNPADLVFLDESGCHTSLHRTHGRALRGQRLAASVPRNWKENTTIIGALSLAGWQALTLPGAADGLAFETFVEKILVPFLPFLRPGQIVILDNLNTHKSAFAQGLVEAAGCAWVFLPPYSPDMNPIEMMGSQLKAYLRAAAARTQEDLDMAISSGLFTVSPTDAVGWFTAAGFPPRVHSP